MTAAAPVKEAASEPSPAFREWQRGQLREAIDTALGTAGVYAAIGRDFNELGDVVGTEYALRMLIAAVKMARDVFGMLKASKGSSDAG